MMKNFRLCMFLLVTLIFNAFSVSNVYAKEDVTPSGIKIESLEDEIDRFMDEKIGKSSPGTSVAIVKDGKVIFSKGYGYADLENQVKVNKDTVFEYGSISKLFVWTSAMQLVEEGKLDLDKDIRDYLSEDFNKKFKVKYPITMRNIMNHSSGFGEYPFDIILNSEPKEDISLEEAILNAHPKQYYKPGESSSYSNYATALAGLVVENISGEKFYEYEKNHIFDKIGMDSTAGHIAWKDNSPILDRKAQGYVKQKDEFKNNGWSYVPLYPAGSVNGTAEDLSKFAIELMSDNSQLLNKNTLNLMMQKSYDKDSSGTAHGLFEYDSEDGSAYGHGGNTVSFSSQFAFHPESKFAMIVLTNAASELDITMGLQNLLIGNSMDKTQASYEEMVDVSKFTGSYVSMRKCVGTPVEFVSYLTPAKVEKLEDGKISFSVYGFEGEYVQVANNEFKLVKTTHPFYNIVYSNLKFQQNENGKYNILFGNGQDYAQLDGIRSSGILIGNVLTIIITGLYFLVKSIINLVNKHKRNEMTNLWNAQFKLNLLGLVTTLTIIGFFGFIIASNSILKYMNILVFQIMFYIIFLIELILIYKGIKSWKKEVRIKNKRGFVVSVIMVVSLINVLAVWNIFNLSSIL